MPTRKMTGPFHCSPGMSWLESSEKLTPRPQAVSLMTQRAASVASQWRTTGLQVALKARLKEGTRRQKAQPEKGVMTMWTQATSKEIMAREARRVPRGERKVERTPEKKARSTAQRMTMRA